MRRSTLCLLAGMTVCVLSARCWASLAWPQEFDELIVVKDGLYHNSIEDLVGHRSSSPRPDFLAFKVLLSEVVAEYGSGAAALRDCIMDAHWNHGVRYVLLVGDDGGQPGTNHIPPYDSLHNMGELGCWDEPIIPYDAGYAWMDDDSLPDLAIGRIYPHSPTETANYINHVIHWETQAWEQPWRRKVVWAIGDHDYGPNHGWLVRQLSDSLIRHNWPDDWTQVAIYQTDFGVYDYQARAESLLAVINQGVSFIAGRSTLSARTRFMDFLRTTHHDMTDFDPNNIFFTALGFSCGVAETDRQETHWGRPWIERWLCECADRGAIAVIGNTRCTHEFGNHWTAETLIEQLFSGRHLTLGDAFVEAQRRYVEEHPTELEQMLSLTFGGDPAVPLRGYSQCADVVEEGSRREMILTVSPNPGQSGVFVEIWLAEDKEAELVVFDVRGRLVKRLVSSGLSAGRHRLCWLGRDEQGRRVASGIYFIRMDAPGIRNAVKLVVIQ